MSASRPVVNDLSAFGTARATITGAPLNETEADQTHSFWRACNYLALGMIYLQDNPLLREPLKPDHIKNRLLGHWGASPALSFIYTHLNRVIKLFDLDMIKRAAVTRSTCLRTSTVCCRSPITACVVKTTST
ncbi:MAG TPA: hypothetical protein VF435_09715 [Pyrinomonadaceae bacterium]